MGVNITVNNDTKVEEINTSIISIWRKVSKDLNDFNNRKDLVLEDLERIREYVINTKTTLLTVKNNAETLLSIMKTIASYIER